LKIRTLEAVLSQNFVKSSKNDFLEFLLEKTNNCPLNFFVVKNHPRVNQSENQQTIFKNLK
jgi:hypothetical protein